MKKEELVSRSSSIGVLDVHISFKIKYCHKMFENEEVRNECNKIIDDVAEKYDIEIKRKGFDDNHVHMVLDQGLKSVPEIAKLFKGTSGRKLLKKFKWMKKQKFWGSGFWSPAVYFHGVGRDFDRMVKYAEKQKFAEKTSNETQTKLGNYAS